MPYLRHVNGFAYNVDMIRARMPDAPVDSLDMIFKPEIIRHFADCGVTFLDSAEDVLQLALNYLHLDPNTTRPEDYQQAEKLLLAVRPYIRAFDSTEYMNGLANGEFCISMSWSADYATSRARAKAAGVDVHLAFTVPKEGANGSFDALLIPADAPHPLAAHKFLNFILEPQVIAAVTNYIHYANDNLAANPYVDPQILNDPAIYPTAGDGGAAVHRDRGESGARAAAHAHLDAHQDRSVREAGAGGARLSARRAALPGRALAVAAHHEVAGGDDAGTDRAHDEARERVDVGTHPELHLGVDDHRQGARPGPGHEARDHQVIERQREATAASWR